MSFSDLTGLSKAAAALAIAGLVFSVHYTQTSNVNGVFTCSYVDYAKIVLGGLAIAIGSLGEVNALRINPVARNVNLMASGLAVLVGIYNLLTGLGIVGGPCA